MSKSAKGTAEQHGKNVKQKSGLNRSILDQSWRILYSQTSFRAFVRLNYLRSSATKWVEFRRQLDYKLLWNEPDTKLPLGRFVQFILSASGTKWSGGYLIAVPPQNTSRCCPACGHTAKDNRQTQAVFECMACGYTENADVVGAINVLKCGQAILAA